MKDKKTKIDHKNSSKDINKNRNKGLLFLLLVFLLISGFLVSSCSTISKWGIGKKSSEYKAFSTQFIGTFDTVIVVMGHMKSQNEFDEFAGLVEVRFRELHELYDIYNNYEGVNNAKTINDRAGQEPVKIESDLFSLLEFGKSWYYKSDGKINIAFGSVLSIWHNFRQRANSASVDNALPKMEDLEAANEHVNHESLILDKDAMTAYISDPEASIDLGAIAKGYATELVCDEMEALGYDSFAISAGGNVKAIGEPKARDRNEWIIGIQNPEEPVLGGANDNLIDKVRVKDLSVVTSGWYQRYFISGGKYYHHIIDPSTLFPLYYSQSVTIVYPDSGISDALSTILMLMPYEEGMEYLKGYPDAMAYWVLQNGSVVMTDNIKDRLILDSGDE